jgi:serine phosphatase RsbU (regulator of sigma subunit)
MLQPFCTIMPETAPAEPQRAPAAPGHSRSEHGVIRAAPQRPSRWLRLSSIQAWPAPAAAGVCALLLALILILDLYTGTEVQVTPCYFLPIILASVRFQAPGGLAVAAVSALLAVWPSPVAMKHAAEPLVLVTNAVIETAGFSFVALVTGALQRQRQRLRDQQRELGKAHEWLREDRRAAELLQAHLLRRPLPEIPELELAAELVFARGVGGDFYDLRRAGTRSRVGQLAICLADVSGKGAKAALISATLRGLLDEAAGRATDPAAFLQRLNALLYDTLPVEMFVTMFYGRLDPASGALEYASAGHDPPLLCRGESIEALPPTAPALGLTPELPRRAGRACLRPGETLLLYTDGLTTARHPEHGRVGEERLTAWLRERAALPPAELAAELLRLACPEGLDSLEDDIALIALRRRE